jgi:hypothetical protein
MMLIERHTLEGLDKVPDDRCVVHLCLPAHAADRARL